MASLRQQQAGRDAADFDADRKEGRYTPGGDRASWFTRDARQWTPAPDQQAALDEALAQIERCFPTMAPVRRAAA